MKQTRDTILVGPQLRAQAEARLSTGLRAGLPAAASTDALVHELQVHQVELEMLNESLLDTQSALEASLERYVDLFDFAPVGYFTLTQDGLISEVNLVGAQLLGMPREALALVRFASLVVEGSQDRWAACFAGLRQAGAPCSTELDLRGPGGAMLSGRLDCSRQVAGPGQWAAMVALTDITARKQAEVALTASRARLRGIFESASDAILTTDATQTIVSANPAAAAMFRCAQADMIGSPLTRFMPERFRQAHWRNVVGFGEGDVVARQMGGARDVMGLRSDGEEFPIDVAISHLNLDGMPLYTAILRDITERRRTEAELRAGKATLEAALASMSDALLIADAQGQVLSVNLAFASFHRFANMGDRGVTLAEYVKVIEVLMANGAPVPQEQWPVARALRGESATALEFRLRHKDTGEAWIGSFTFAPIRAQDGVIVGAVVTARDVTELNQRQGELESAHADLQRLIVAMDKIQEDERQRIARDLHDDLQQTLAAIRIDVGVIDRQLAAGPQAVAPILAKVDELASAAILSTRRIVNDLQPRMLEELGLVPALEALAEQFSRRTGITCQTEALDAPDAWDQAPVVAASVATSLYRVAQEALNNVSKHAQASAVHLRLSSVEGGQLVMRISDNGKGMSVADRKKAQSFGLLGMQERVRALGGALRIESQLGAGTAIEVVVPLPGQQAALLAPVVGLVAPSMQEAIDALPGNVAVLDQQGFICYVNRAWREFAQHNGDPGLVTAGPNVNYLAVCRRAAEQDEQVGQVLQGLQEVLDGRRDAFMAAYPCHVPHAQQWFLLQAAPMVGGYVQVTHLDVSHVSDIVRLSEPAG